MSDVRRAHPSEAGCWIPGHVGWRGIAVVTDIAIVYGMTMPPAWQDAVERFRRGTDDRDDTTYDEVFEIAGEAERWLNEHVAPEGYAFGWEDGEFFLSETSAVTLDVHDGQIGQNPVFGEAT